MTASWLQMVFKAFRAEYVTTEELHIFTWTENELEGMGITAAGVRRALVRAFSPTEVAARGISETAYPSLRQFMLQSAVVIFRCLSVHLWKSRDRAAAVLHLD